MRSILGRRPMCTKSVIVRVGRTPVRTSDCLSKKISRSAAQRRLRGRLVALKSERNRFVNSNPVRQGGGAEEERREGRGGVVDFGGVQRL
jgi:hypothetical protein